MVNGRLQFADRRVVGGRVRVERLSFANSSTCALILAKPARLAKLDVAKHGGRH